MWVDIIYGFFVPAFAIIPQFDWLTRDERALNSEILCRHIAM